MTAVPPFYSNSSDDIRCFEAVLGSVLEHFDGKKHSFEELDAITGKRPGMWTWPIRTILYLLDHGYAAQAIETFDYSEFSKHPLDYLIETFGEEVAFAQNEHSDLAYEAENARLLMSSRPGIISDRPAHIRDIRDAVQDGQLVVCNVNACALNNKEGYVGHAVLVFASDDTTITLHDPGLPPMSSRRISHKTFMRAWSYPDQNACNMISIKR